MSTTPDNTRPLAQMGFPAVAPRAPVFAPAPPAPPPAPAPALPVQASPRDEEEPTSSPRPRAKRRESTVALYVRVPESLQRNLKLRAVAEGIAISELVTELLSETVGSWSAPYRRNQKAG